MAGPAEDARGVRRPGARFDAVKAKLSSFYFEDRVEPVTPAELEEAHHDHHGGHEAVEGADDERPALTGH